MLKLNKGQDSLRFDEGWGSLRFDKGQSSIKIDCCWSSLTLICSDDVWGFSDQLSLVNHQTLHSDDCQRLSDFNTELISWNMSVCWDSVQLYND